MLYVIFQAVLLVALSVSTGFKLNSTGPRNLGAALNPYVKNYDLRRFTKFLTTVRFQNDFPEYDSPPTSRDGTLPPSFTARFREMNLAVFGRPAVLKLVAVDGDYSALHRASRTVGVPRELVSSLEANPALLDFTLAHAMAHYLYELQISEYSMNHLSFYGNPSRRHEGTHSSSSEMGAAHAEIDVFAVAILLKLGENPEQMGRPIIASFIHAKRTNDRFLGRTLNDMTYLRTIPDDLIPKVRDNYIRVSTLATLFFNMSRRGS